MQFLDLTSNRLSQLPYELRDLLKTYHLKGFFGSDNNTLIESTRVTLEFQLQSSYSDSDMRDEKL